MRKSDKSLRLVDARFYRYWQAFYLSLYSRRLYIDVAKRWKGFGFIYLLLLLSLVTLPISIHYMKRFNQYTYTDFIEPLLRLPSFDIRDGHAVFKVKTPLYIKNKQGKVLIAIDEKGSKEYFKTLYPDLIILITSENYYFREPVSPFFRDNQPFLHENEIETSPFNELSNGPFNLAETIQDSGLMTLKNGFLIGIYPFLIWAFFGLFSVILLILAFLGQLTAHTIFRFKITFKSACRLMAVASTLSLYVFFTLKTLGYPTAGVSFYCGLGTYIYFCFAVLVVRRESQTLVHL